MSATGTQVAPDAQALACGCRSSMAYLLHALNQPLTGLQCSLELAAAAPRSEEQYACTVREALGLTGRMRVLVEALRELSDSVSPVAKEVSSFDVDELLLATADELRPVAETKGVHLRVAGGVPLPVRYDRLRVASVLFRLLESILSLCEKETELRVVAAAEQGVANLGFSWTQGKSPKDSPFSRPELGLLVAQAAWREAGGESELVRTGRTQTCTIRLPMHRASANVQRLEDGK